MRTALLRHASSRLLKSQPDHVLVELAHAGHEPAFEAIVIRYRHHLLRVARSVGPADRAEDVLQQALLQAYRALRRDERVADLRPWLRRIVVNASVDLSRRTGPRPDAVRDEELVGESVEPILERREQIARLVKALGDLPDRQRDAIVMRELEGRPVEEIASEFGTSDGAVRQLVRRARAQLRTGVAALVPPALLARMLTHSHGDELAGAGGMGIGAKVGTAVAVGASAVAVGTVAPSLDRAPSPPPVPQAAAPLHAPPADRAHPATTAPQAAAPKETTAPADRPAAASEQQGNHEGTDRQAAAASAGPHEGQSQSGDSRDAAPAGDSALQASAAAAGEPNAGQNNQVQ